MWQNTRQHTPKSQFSYLFSYVSFNYKSDGEEKRGKEVIGMSVLRKMRNGSKTSLPYPKAQKAYSNGKITLTIASRPSREIM